jgi:hypothetical protein
VPLVCSPLRSTGCFVRAQAHLMWHLPAHDDCAQGGRGAAILVTPTSPTRAAPHVGGPYLERMDYRARHRVACGAARLARRCASCPRFYDRVVMVNMALRFEEASDGPVGGHAQSTSVPRGRNWRYVLDRVWRCASSASGMASCRRGATSSWAGWEPHSRSGFLRSAELAAASEAQWRHGAIPQMDGENWGARAAVELNAHPRAVVNIGHECVAVQHVALEVLSWIRVRQDLSEGARSDGFRCQRVVNGHNGFDTEEVCLKRSHHQHDRQRLPRRDHQGPA